MGCRVKKVIQIMEDLAPLYLAEEWDNSGLQIGDINKDVNRIMVALDISLSLIEQAKKEDVDMIITHHPFLFNSLKCIDLNTIIGQIISEIIRNDIVIYSAHTNLDAAPEGVNTQLANILQLNNISPLLETYSEKYYKLAVFVPEGYQDVVREAITQEGAGWIGNYSCCTFQTEGIGTFLPMQGSSPFIGKQGHLEKVKEYKIETIVKQKDLHKTIDSMLEVHPYQEVAYDIYPLKNKFYTYGMGRIGSVHSKMTFIEYAEFVKDKLNVKNLNIAGNRDKKINRVAVCGGSGSALIQHAINKGADLFITGDVKYHDAQRAVNSGLCIIDAGHYHTELIVLPFLTQYLSKHLDIEVIQYSKNEPILFNL